MSNDTRAIQSLFETGSLGAPENAIGFVLWRVLHRYTREIDRALAEVDLTHLQFTVLALAAWLGRAGDPVMQSKIAAFGDIHAMQVSQLLKVLEGKGMIRRSRSSLDVRAKHVEMTSAGIKSLRHALPLAIEIQRNLFGEAGGAGGALLDALLRIDRVQP